MKSIKYKVITYFAIALFCVSLSLGIFSFYMASNSVTDEVEKSLEQLAFDGAKLVESRIETQMRTLEILAGFEGLRTMDWEEQQPILAAQLERSGFLALAVVDPDGMARYYDNSTLELGNRDYVIQAFSGESNISNLIVSRATNELVMMYAVPIERDGLVEGVLIGRMDANLLSVLTDDMGLGEKGYAFIINEAGDVIAHRDRELVLDQFNPLVHNGEGEESYAVLFQEMTTEIRGNGRLEEDGDNTLVGYSAVGESGWTLGITASESEVLNVLPVLRKNISIATAIIVLLGVIAAYFFGNSISKPIMRATRQCEVMATGNFSTKMDEMWTSQKDETGALARGLNLINENVTSIIQQIIYSAEQVAASSQELTATSQQFAMATEEVARAIEEIANSTNEQAFSTEKGAFAAEELGNLIAHDLDDMRIISEKIALLRDMKDKGSKMVEMLTAKNADTTRDIKEISDVIKLVSASSEKIDSATSIIEGIAKQTNLLALNASIEAARAGEAGRGFAVVADEIRKLAEQSSLSVKEIDNVINELLDQSEKAVSSMVDVNKTVSEQTLQVSNTKESFNSIAMAVDEMSTIILRSTESVQNMEHKKNEFISIMQNLSAISEENAASTEQTAATTQEQTASMQEISSSSSALAKLAQDLQGLINRFKI